MLTYIKGNLLNSPAQVLVNTVNTVGVMGKGIALQFKNKYPEMFRVYQKECDKKNLDIGKLILWKDNGKWVLLFPTKKHWRSPSKIEYIEKGLDKFVQSDEMLGIESIAFPRLGCGNGGLDWNLVKPMMERYLKDLPINIYIYVDKYIETIPEYEQPTEIEKWLRNNPELVGFTKLKEDLQKIILNNDSLLLDNSELKHISWQGDGIHLVNGDNILIPEEDLCDFWEFVRDVGVIQTDKLPARFTEYGASMLDIFRRIDYVQPVIISKNGNDFIQKSNGYQYINV